MRDQRKEKRRWEVSLAEDGGEAVNKIKI